MTTPSDPDQERLDRLEDGVEAARRQAEEDGMLPSSEPERTFIDPDGDGDTDEDAPGVIGGF